MSGPIRAGRYARAVAINDTRESVQRIVDELFAQGILTAHVEATLERPKSREHGDYATNVALVAAKSSSLPPRELAHQIAERLSADPAFTDVSVAGPGFVNIRLSAQTQGGNCRAGSAPGLGLWPQ